MKADAMMTMNPIVRRGPETTKPGNEPGISQAKAIATDAPVSISANAQQIIKLERMIQSVDNPTGNNLPEPIDVGRMDALMERMKTELVGEDDILLAMGWSMMGAMAEGWAAQGFEVTEESVIEAGRVLNDAFKEGLENSQGRFGIALDQHAIVASQQPVPDWFMDERALQLDALPDAYRDDFENGQAYHITYLV
ncbi:hypothetical protein BGP77_17590 [Saccharospirillum sp. MSK14-1]|uniref:hypothetical protein n=1 Tax=Saccharospirillum sp. MSK14-1 TaxID=1897632 RepID=UPI000D396F18|nr:hypothetical protein [Saccharospirillum sp. MSK14-1]PTY38252.1 hypothetical protein BGP77_17590 [Saccharospirillum sp. MSK14-1]